MDYHDLIILANILIGLRWYCPQCAHIIFEENFHCVDLGIDFDF